MNLSKNLHFTVVFYRSPSATIETIFFLSDIFELKGTVLCSSLYPSALLRCKLLSFGDIGCTVCLLLKIIEVEGT